MADKLFAPLQKNVQLRSAAEKPGPFQALAKYVQALAIFTPGFSAAKQGSPDAQKSITELQAMRKQAGKEVVLALGMSLSDLLEIQRLEIAAAASAAKGDLAEAIKSNPESNCARSIRRTASRPTAAYQTCQRIGGGEFCFSPSDRKKPASSLRLRFCDKKTARTP